MGATTLYETDGTIVTPRGRQGPARGKALGRLRTVARGALAVRDGTIVEVGPRAQLRRAHAKAERVQLGDALVVPGFVDAHNHLPFAGDRAFELDLKVQGATYLQILEKGGGIHRTVRETRKASVTALATAVRLRLDAMLASGTTTSEAKSGYGLRWADEKKQLVAVKRAAGAHPVRVVPTFLGAHVVPKGADRTRYVTRVVDEMIPNVAKHQLARFCDVFFEKGAFNRAETGRVLKAAAAAGLKTKIHADEFTNGRGAKLGVELGCTSVDHLMHIDSEGVNALSRSATAAVLLPLVHRASFETRTAPARALVDAGAIVALGTDFNPNCHNPSMLEAFRAAVYDLRLRPREALAAATLNAAYALDEHRRTGSLEEGWQADFLVIEATDVDEVAYRQAQNPIRQACAGGQLLTLP